MPPRGGDGTAAADDEGGLLGLRVPAGRGVPARLRPQGGRRTCWRSRPDASNRACSTCLTSGNSMVDGPGASVTRTLHEGTRDPADSGAGGRAAACGARDRDAGARGGRGPGPGGAARRRGRCRGDPGPADGADGRGSSSTGRATCAWWRTWRSASTTSIQRRPRLAVSGSRTRRASSTAPPPTWRWRCCSRRPVDCRKPSGSCAPAATGAGGRCC